MQQKTFTPIKVTTSFKEIRGLRESKHEITEFVEFLKNPRKYTEIGARLPKGALLSGPPGTGKTLLAKAVAGESKVPFFYCSGSEFVEIFVGMGGQRVRQLFETAKKEKKAIIFIDEIDAIGKKRSSSMDSNMERDQTLNQLLVEMDGFQSQGNIIIFAATNRKELLDEALTRTGRFDRSIDVNLPDLEERKDIYDLHLTPLKLTENDNIQQHQIIRNQLSKRLASLSPGFSGADIANVCNEAAIRAVKLNHLKCEKIDFEFAIEKVIGGIEKEDRGELEQREIVSIHECGHGVIAWFLEGSMPLLKLTIIPRSKGALGFAQYLPNEDSLQTEQELRHQIISILAGRIAEEEFFGRITTGAYDDLQKAYKYARAIVTQLGMDSSIGFQSFQENDYGKKNYGDNINEQIDQRCELIIHQSTQECRILVKKYKNEIFNLSKVLLEKETIDLKDIVSVLGKRPFIPKENFKAYLEENLKDQLINQ